MPQPLPLLALAPRLRGKTSSPQLAPQPTGPSVVGCPRATCPARRRSCPGPPQRTLWVPSAALVQAVFPPLCSPLPRAPLGDLHAQRQQAAESPAPGSHFQLSGRQTAPEPREPRELGVGGPPGILDRLHPGSREPWERQTAGGAHARLQPGSLPSPPSLGKVWRGLPWQ